MPIKILMPALSPTMKSGKIVEWKIKEGDVISSGMEILDIETDKAVMPLEAADEGTLAKITVPAGTENVPVGKPIGIMLEEGETKADIAEDDTQESQELPQTAAQEQSAAQAETKTAAIDPDKGNKSNNKPPEMRSIKASPLARRIAAQQNIDLSKISGSGPYGRIVKDDIMSQMPIQAEKREVAGQEISKMRKAIAKRLLESTQNIPHFYLTIDCEIDSLLKLKSAINENGEHKITVNDLIIKAAALSIARLPEMNCSWGEEQIMQNNAIDISFAVAIEDGLITPIVKNADQKSISQISSEIKHLASKAQENKLTPEEFEGGSFTVSNLGMYGIKSFIAIINPPQSAILAIGKGEKRPVARGEKIEVAMLMTATLSCDHRIIDGAIGANFMKIFKEYIENPVSMLI
ncbi:dihydrolipoyllysine-residue acetyltransferase component of pyruvate dehydrogenase complex [Rickettsiales bacterium]|nr:dihydrolipoyllysine-residue acetyltransferase component of pyruvate dehydrogenase complex [Rickettsiales bacterium]